MTENHRLIKKLRNRLDLHDEESVPDKVLIECSEDSLTYEWCKFTIAVEDLIFTIKKVSKGKRKL